MNVTGYYILNGTVPVPEPDLLKWARWYATAERHVAETWLTLEVRVSTVFLGLDYQWRDGPPLLFETIIFHQGDGREKWRWSTRHAAEQGHEAAVALARAALEAQETQP